MEVKVKDRVRARVKGGRDGHNKGKKNTVIAGPWGLCYKHAG